MNEKHFFFLFNRFCFATLCYFFFLEMLNIVVFLAVFSTVIHAEWILDKSDHDIIDRDDDYWYVKSKFYLNSTFELYFILY